MKNIIRDLHFKKRLTLMTFLLTQLIEFLYKKSEAN